MRPLGLLLAALTLWPAPAARAYCRMTTSTTRPSLAEPCVMEGLPLEWRRRCFEYSIDVDGTPDMDRATFQGIVAASFDSWLAVRCPDVAPGFEIRETADPAVCREAEYRGRGGNVNTIAFVDDWSAHDYEPTAFAVTTVWHITDTGEIIDVDMQLNQNLGPYGVCPAAGCPGAETGTSEVADLQNIITHEIGHVFGIGHSDVVGATMYAISRRGETDKRILRTDDVDAMCSIYPPGTLPAECDFTPVGGLRLSCPNRGGGGGCGCSLASSNERGAAPGWIVLLGAALLFYRRRS
ncbi:MAG: matrixin family metalloprotease [Deltaproteobacteria bacterium]|nr:matrixin family metalloprotease [Deltaproteobacteria bacterium]